MEGLSQGIGMDNAQQQPVNGQIAAPPSPGVLSFAHRQGLPLAPDDRRNVLESPIFLPLPLVRPSVLYSC